MSQLIDHVRILAEEIGPRPAGSDAEHHAADWLSTYFGSYGLETEVQEFNAPRTYSWAYAVYHLLTVASAFAAGYKPFLLWPAFVVAVLTAALMWMDLDTRWGLSRLARKAPSQNVIARHVPRARRGERLRRIVIVAHYDSAKASLAFSPGMVGGFPTTFGLMKWCTYLVPVLIFALAMPFAKGLSPWLWYATMVVSAYLLVPLFINVHRELFMPWVDGANDNASGVAAMLGVMERLIPAPDASSLVTAGPQLKRGVEAAAEADVIPEDSILQYTPAGSAEEHQEQSEDIPWVEPRVSLQSGKSQGVLDFDTMEFAAVEGVGSTRRSEIAEEPAPGPEYHEAEQEAPRKGSKGLLGKLGKKRESRESEDVSGWLGVDEDFDARKAGGKIGSWDNFNNHDNDDDDGFGWKGGWAGDDPIGDPEFAANEAARIRRRVTESIDRELTEKEIWFVATGAEEAGTYGMQALLREHGGDLKDALIINIDGCGDGQLYWASAEGMARRYRASQRLVGLARRVSRETDTIIKPRVFKGLSTDATPALARGYKAVSIMALGPKGLPMNWHWKSDHIDNVDPELLEKTADFVAAMVRDA